MAERQGDLTPEERVSQARTERDEAAAEGRSVDSIVRKLHRHLEENHFAERFYQQLAATRRHA
jgi:hypothetical protein